MYKAIAKLNSTVMKPQLVYLYFNTYLIKKVFFRCRIIKLYKEQTRILQKMYGKIIIKKLGVEENFLRGVLYSRRNTVGYGLVKAETVLAMISMKLYVGNIRANTRNKDLNCLNKEVVMVEYGYREVKWDERKLQNKITWYEEI